ncbi:MAG: hypothetical protein M1289_02420 [Patescibacteria group bacterium]|nr:hypothetical protein [Patescibacteria group bacterium]
MKIVVAHNSPDWDAITSVWLIKRFLPGWEEASVQFVPAGERFERDLSLGDSSLLASELATPSAGSNIHSLHKSKSPPSKQVIEKVGGNEVIHVDTGLGPLDHHQTAGENISAASLTLDYVIRIRDSEFRVRSDRIKTRIEALNRMIKVIVAIDHFQEVFWDNPTADYHEVSILGILEGLKLLRPNQDDFYVEFGMKIMDCLLRNFENRIWAEREIGKGKEFKTKWGEGIGFETINDQVLDLAQKMGYIMVFRKDSRKGYVRIKARPEKDPRSKVKDQKGQVDLTPVYEELRRLDPKASWFLHVSKKMLLNGSSKNPKMRVTKLSLNDIIKALKNG